jgi:hypothetical protein
MKSLRWLALVSTLLLSAVRPADAQILSRLPLSLQARIGSASPTGGFAEASPGLGAEPGLAWELGGLLQPTRWLGVYAGYQQGRFGCAECEGVGVDGSAVASGVEAGAQLSSPVQRFGLRPWVRGGVVRHFLRFSRGESGLRSDPGLGFGIGGGVELEFAGVRVAPGVRFQSYPVEVVFSGYPSRSLDVSHLTLDLGLILPF